MSITSEPASSLPTPSPSPSPGSPTTQTQTQTLLHSENDASTTATTDNGGDALKVHNDTAREDAPVAPPYCAFSPSRRRFVLVVITVAGFLGPLAGAIYLPALPVFEREFGVGSTAMNATVSVFMVVFAFGVSASFPGKGGLGIWTLTCLGVAVDLVQLCRCQRTTTALYLLTSHFHCCEYPPRSTAQELWRARLSAHRPGVWFVRCRVHGCWYRCRCMLGLLLLSRNIISESS